MCERKPDTIVITFPTFVDVVVDLQTGQVKNEFEGEYDLERPVCSTSWAEGELLATSDDGTQSGYAENDDRVAYLSAMKSIRAARAQQ